MSPQQARGGVRAAQIHVTRSGSRVTVRFRVERLTKVRVLVRDRGGRLVGRSPLRTAPGGRSVTVHVRIRRGARGPLEVTVRNQPERRSP